MNARRAWPLFLAAATLASGFACSPEAAPRAPRLPERVQFNQHVRAILADNCFACHGRDASQRKGDLRLDVAESARAERKSGPAIVPGAPDRSELVRRIHSTDPDYRMPPPAAKRTLSAHEKALLTRWIEQGAAYQEHWAYLPLRRPDPPAVADKAWTLNAIDQFVLARLEADGIAPSPEADRRVLARRLSFDLTGLPLPPAAVEAFIADDRPHAYAALVDRLLASAHYGERMATFWLDLVRFADTTGYNEDQPRNIYLYRDYVIHAFNDNMPFDRFTREQLAGDLLPAPTVSQRIATGYNRLNKVSKENGSQPREFVAKYAADRVRTTASVWLGATLGCAECHDHKFDPYSAKDFYRFAAFFADIDEDPVPPLMKIGMPPEIAVLPAHAPARVTRELDQLTRELAALHARADAQRGHLGAELERWLTAAPRPSTAVVASGPPFDRATWIPDGAGVSIDASRLRLRSSAAHARNRVRRTTPTGDGSLEFLLDLSTLRFPEPSSNTTDWFEWTLRSAPGQPALFVRVPRQFNVVYLQLMIDPEDGRLVELGAPNDLRSLQLRLTWNAPQREWRASYGLNGNPPVTAVPGGPIRAPLGDPTGTWIENLTLLSLDKVADAHVTDVTRLEAVIDRHVIRHLDALGDPPADVAAARALPAAARSAAQTRMLEEYYAANAPALAPSRAALNALEFRKWQLQHRWPRSMVTESVPPRITRVLHRGDWQDERGEIVAPGVPAFLGGAQGDAPPDRLGLARWLVSADNPLTARTLVNRLWALCMGHGIVRTLDDLGAQGTPPTHPELLDWLAAELIESGWDIKHVMRLLVTSATYRQASDERPDLHDVDPDNHLYARQTGRRLDAEMIRDNALAASGLLTRSIGGPSIKPYQPADYWRSVSPILEPAYRPSRGQDQYRRGLYIYWKRNDLHPSLLVFDAPTREECTAERTRSNTPLQALLLLNDPTFIEAARVLAERGLAAEPGDPAAQIRWVHRQTLARDPDAAAAATLAALYDAHLARYRAHPERAGAIARVGNSPAPANVEPASLAALTSVCRVVLNLHETITRY